METAARIELDLQLTLKNELAQKLLTEADKRKRRPVDLLADLIEVAISDDLFAAVLDN